MAPVSRQATGSLLTGASERISEKRVFYLMLELLNMSPEMANKQMAYKPELRLREEQLGTQRSGGDS